MNELSSEARDLLDSGRAGMMPDRAARARVRSAVLTRVGVAVAAGTTLTAATTTATAATGAKLGSGVLVKLLVSVAIVGSVGTAGYVASTRSEPPAPTPLLTPPAESERAPRTAPPELAVALEPELPTIVEQPARPVGRRVAKRESIAAPATTLQKQLSVLRAANRGLQRGDAAAALAAVDEYDKRFPDGDLHPEVSVIRIDALCELDRTEQARRLSKQFLARWPKSPLAERVRASCAQGGDR